MDSHKITMVVIFALAGLSGLLYFSGAPGVGQSQEKQSDEVRADTQQKAALPFLVEQDGSDGQEKGLGPLSKAFLAWPHKGALIAEWEKYYKDTLKQGVITVDQAYPTETGRVFLSAWLCTGANEYRAAAALAFQAAHDRETNGLLLYDAPGIAGKVFSRDMQARQIYNLFTAYKILDDPKYLSWADACADAMIKKLPRIPHISIQNNLLFVANELDPTKPIPKALDAPIDPNHNCEIALAFTLLFFESKSKFHEDPTARQIVHNEVEAALSLQRPDGGLAMAENRKGCCDTAYGGYAGFSLVWLNQLWQDQLWAARVQRLGGWLAGYSRDQGPHSDRCYNAQGDKLSGWEMWYRIPVLWRKGKSPAHLIQAFSDKQKKGIPDWYLGFGFAYYQVMAIPPAYFLTK